MYLSPFFRRLMVMRLGRNARLFISHNTPDTAGDGQPLHMDPAAGTFAHAPFITQAPLRVLELNNTINNGQ